MAKPHKDSKLALAMVALKEGPLPSEKEIFTRLREEWPRAPRPAKIDREGDIITFELGDAMAAIAPMPGPIPWSDLEGPCETAWYWPEAAAVLKDHKTHAIVTLGGGKLGVIDRHLLLTSLVASFAATSATAGIYWGAGTVVQSPEAFLEDARMMSREYLPLHLWIDFRLAGERKGTISLFTTGMAAFGHMEIEIWESHEKPRDVYDIGVNVAHYLLDRGPVLKDGQTIGMSPEQKLRIRLLPSRWDRPGNVVSIEV